MRLDLAVIKVALYLSVRLFVQYRLMYNTFTRNKRTSHVVLGSHVKRYHTCTTHPPK